MSAAPLTVTYPQSQAQCPSDKSFPHTGHLCLQLLPAPHSAAGAEEAAFVSSLFSKYVHLFKNIENKS